MYVVVEILAEVAEYWSNWKTRKFHINVHGCMLNAYYWLACICRTSIISQRLVQGSDTSPKRVGHVKSFILGCHCDLIKY
jgi:hypothetical protein